jgi:diaminopimelate epimerase
MKFFKYSANGNDFVLFEEPPPSKNLSDFILRTCHRHEGIGADGVIFLYKDKKLKAFVWRFFNKDSSETALCGNGTRAVGLHLFNKGKSKKEISWHGKLGVFKARLKNKNIAHKKIQVQWPQSEITWLATGEDLQESLSGFNDRGLAFYALINVGNPQLVLINHETWNPQDRLSNNSFLRSHPDLGSEGANVTWLSLKDMSCVTFERGVEEETLACGSGALAASLALRKFKDIQSQEKIGEKNKEKKTVHTLHFPGGPLEIQWTREGFWLSGTVKKTFEGRMP